jgi:MFS family permease
MGERFLPLYLLALGGGIFSVGTFNFLQNLLNAFSSYPAGWLTDKLGVRRALMVFALAAITGYLLVIFSPHWSFVVIGFVIILTWSAVSLPAAMSLVSQVLPSKKRTVGVALHSLVRRFPMALGPILAGLFVDSHGDKDGVRLALYLGLGFCVLGGFVLQALLQVDKSGETKPMGDPLRLFKKMAPDLKELLVSDILIRFCEQIPYPFVILWCMKTIAKPVSGFQFGILTAVEMATAILVYLPVARMADKAGKRPFVLITFFFFSAFPFCLYFSRSMPLLIAAFILRGLKEFGEPARKALILDLCPKDQKAGMFGFYYLLRDTVVSLAALGGAFLWAQSPELNLFTATGFGLLGTLWFWLKGREV